METGVSETKNTKWRHENRATFVIHKGKGEGGSEKWTRKGRPGPNQYGFFFWHVERLRLFL